VPADALNQLDAVHLWHRKIADESIDLRSGIEVCESGDSRFRRNDVCAARTEQQRECVQRRRVIIDHEYRNAGEVRKEVRRHSVVGYSTDRATDHQRGYGQYQPEAVADAAVHLAPAIWRLLSTVQRTKRRDRENKTMSSPSDAEVIGRSLGEPEVFGLIYDRHAATLLRFLGRRVGANVAEGLHGELFRIAFERRKTFDASRASALPWLYGIGANLLLKHRRAEARWLRASARMVASLEAGEGRTSAAALDARVLFPRAADAIEALPAGEREALLLFAWEELSYQGVAEALELPIGTVRSRLNRARARLRELLEPRGKTG